MFTIAAVSIIPSFFGLKFCLQHGQFMIGPVTEPTQKNVNELMHIIYIQEWCEWQWDNVRDAKDKQLKTQLQNKQNKKIRK